MKKIITFLKKRLSFSSAALFVSQLKDEAIGVSDQE